MLKGKINFLLIKEEGEVASFHLWKDAILWALVNLLFLHPLPPNQTHKLHLSLILFILPPTTPPPPPPKQTHP